MHIYMNGDRCPCCGQTIQDLSDGELIMFSQLCHVLRLEPLDEDVINIQPLDTSDFPPPDAGINPPVKPIFDI